MELLSAEQILAKRRKHPPITPKDFATARGIGQSAARKKFERLAELGVPYVWREGESTAKFPNGKLLFMDREIFEKVCHNQFRLPA